MKPTASKSGPSSAEGTPNPDSRRERRRRQKRQSEPASPAPQPEASGSRSKLRLDDTPRMVEAREPKLQRSGFEDGADYIGFDFKDDEDGESVVRFGGDKGKGKARETSRERERTPERERERERKERRDGRRARDRERSRERKRDDERKKDRERRDRDRSRDRDRHRDRDMDSRGTKRRKDSFDIDDGYVNKKQRLDAASRKSPWVANLDWTQCRHVAELCVPCSILCFPQTEYCSVGYTGKLRPL